MTRAPYDFRQRRSDFQIPNLLRELIEDEVYAVTIYKKDGCYNLLAFADTDDETGAADLDYELTNKSLVGVLRDALDWVQHPENRPKETEEES